MDWRERYADKLAPAEEAVKAIKSGDHVAVGMLWGTPLNLCQALFDRRAELQDVLIHHTLATFPWVVPGAEGAFRVMSAFLTLADRKAMSEGRLEYVIYGRMRREDASDLTSAFGSPDVFMVRVSPPDDNGYCSFGECVWASRSLAAVAKTIIAEVDERAPRTFGDNFIHVSQIDHLVEHQGAAVPFPLPAPAEEMVQAIEVINALVADELIRDGDTLQMGGGDVSARLAPYLGEKHDLGIHSEVIWGGTPELVQKGVVTGANKTLHPGKVVGTSFGPLREDELAFIHGNPLFELYDIGYTNDIRTLMALGRFVAVNNALMIDVTGQLTAESIGPSVYSGTGGQLAFAFAACNSPGGRAITVLPSTSLVNGELRSRIVPVLPEGTVVTVPRTYVEYVVTEHGVAQLMGKTLRQRIEEMVSIAHPDFRTGLRREAKRLYAV